MKPNSPKAQQIQSSGAPCNLSWGSWITVRTPAPGDKPHLLCRRLSLVQRLCFKPPAGSVPVQPSPTGLPFQPPLPFGERTRDCSPGHAGKEGPQLARTGVLGSAGQRWSQGSLQAAPCLPADPHLLTALLTVTAPSRSTTPGSFSGASVTPPPPQFHCTPHHTAPVERPCLTAGITDSGPLPVPLNPPVLQVLGTRVCASSSARPPPPPPPAWGSFPVSFKLLHHNFPSKE